MNAEPSLSDRRRRSLATRLCEGVAALAVVCTFAAAVAWAADNRLPTFWDEANYFGDAASDYWALRDHRPLVQRALTLVKTDVGQPPAHRGVLALTLVFGPRSEVLRFASLAGLFGALLLVFGAAKRVAGPAAGAIATLVMLASPIVLASSIRFGTEYTLFVAEAATLYCLLASLGRTRERRCDVVALGLALGLGLWSKPSFVIVAAPALALTFALAYRRVCGPPQRWLIKAGALGAVLGAIYLVPFSLKTLNYLDRSVNRMGGRHSLGHASPATLAKYVPIVVSTVTGPVVAVLLALSLLAAASLWRAKRPLAQSDTVALAGLGVAFSGAVLLPFSHFFSADHDMRYLAADMVPVSLFVGIALSHWALRRGPALTPLVAIAIFAQISTMLFPIARQSKRQRFEDFGRKAVLSNLGNSADIVFAPQEQWDWQRLRATCGIGTLHDPVVAYLGSGEAFNEKQIVYAWIRHDEPVRRIRLWDYTKGPIDWARTMSSADDADIALTAPGYRGLAADRQPLDNVHNAAFAERMKSDSHFEKPLTLVFGRFEPTTVLVFINKRSGLRCSGPA